MHTITDISCSFTDCALVTNVALMPAKYKGIMKLYHTIKFENLLVSKNERVLRAPAVIPAIDMEDISTPNSSVSSIKLSSTIDRVLHTDVVSVMSPAVKVNILELTL